MTREEILNYFKDINFMYNNSSMFDTLKRMLDELTEPCEDRMKYVQETVNTMLNACTTNSIKDKVFRNAARFVQNAIDGKAPDFEKIDEPEPCEDAVSREAVIEILKNSYRMKALDEIQALPSVTPERHKGEWIWDSFCEDYTCSCCYSGSEEKTNFCPTCGADMRGEQK